MRLNLLQLLSFLLLCPIEVIALLQIHPEARGCSKISRQPKGCAGGDPSFAVDQLVDPASVPQSSIASGANLSRGFWLMPLKMSSVPGSLKDRIIPS